MATRSCERGTCTKDSVWREKEVTSIASAHNRSFCDPCVLQHCAETGKQITYEGQPGKSDFVQIGPREEFVVSHA